MIPAFSKAICSSVSPRMRDVIEADAGDDRNEGSQHVGRIEPPAEPDFDDRQVDLLSHEVHEPQRGRHLEERRPLALGFQLFDGRPNPSATAANSCSEINSRST